MIFIANPLPCQGREASLIHVKLPKEDCEYIRGVFPGHGNLQAVTATLLKQLIARLKEAQVARYEFDNEEIIRAILDGRRPDPGSAPEPLPSALEGGTARLHPSFAEHPCKHPHHPDKPGQAKESV